jgi:hypothetical protein
MVPFRQSSKFVSALEGSGVSAVEFSGAKTALLLYPSRLSATELAR